MNKKMEDFSAAQELMKERLGSLCDTVMGRSSSFLPFITDENGSVTEERLENFIKKLSDGGMCRIKDTPEFIEACECFLYCALQGIAEYDDEYRRVLRANTRFCDITAMAGHRNNLLFTDIETVQRAEYEADGDDTCEGYPCGAAEGFKSGGFLRSSDTAYRLLTGRGIVSAFDKSDFGRYAVEEPLKSRIPADDRLRTERRISAEINAEWCGTAASPEKFAEKYLRFRELFFRMSLQDKGDVFEYIGFMTDYFLYEQGMSALSERSTAAMTDHRIEKLCTAVRQSVKGALSNAEK